MESSQNVLREKSFVFAVRIIELSRFLREEKKEFVLAKQILRSGTSIGANIEEANGAISKAEFSQRMSLSYKEARETKYWLRLLHETKYLETKLFESLFQDCDEIAGLLFSVLKTTRIRKKNL